MQGFFKVVSSLCLLILVTSQTWALRFSESPSSDGSFTIELAYEDGEVIHEIKSLVSEASSPLIFGVEREAITTANSSTSVTGMLPAKYKYTYRGSNLSGGSYGPTRTPVSYSGFVEVLRDELGLSSQKIDLDQYDFYYGDFNNDGLDGDIYLRGKSTFIFVGTDVLTPIKLDAAVGFVYYQRYPRGNTALFQAGITGYANPVLLDIPKSELVNYRKALPSSDYLRADLRGTGSKNDVFIRGLDRGYPALVLVQEENGLPYAYTPQFDINERFDPSDRRNFISFQDMNFDGRDDLVWLTGLGGIILDTVYTDVEGVVV